MTQDYSLRNIDMLWQLCKLYFSMLHYLLSSQLFKHLTSNCRTTPQTFTMKNLNFFEFNGVTQSLYLSTLDDTLKIFINSRILAYQWSRLHRLYHIFTKNSTVLLTQLKITHAKEKLIITLELNVCKLLSQILSNSF